MVGLMMGNLDLERFVSGAIKRDFESISPPQIEILTMVIPILMQLCSFVSNWSVACQVKSHVIQ